MLPMLQRFSHRPRSCFLRPIPEKQPHPVARTGELNGIVLCVLENPSRESGYTPDRPLEITIFDNDGLGDGNISTINHLQLWKCGRSAFYQGRQRLFECLKRRQTE